MCDFFGKYFFVRFFGKIIFFMVFCFCFLIFLAIFLEKYFFLCDFFLENNFLKNKFFNFFSDFLGIFVFWMTAPHYFSLEHDQCFLRYCVLYDVVWGLFDVVWGFQCLDEWFVIVVIQFTLRLNWVQGFFYWWIAEFATFIFIYQLTKRGTFSRFVYRVIDSLRTIL